MNRWYRAYEGTVTDAKLAEVALVAGCSRSVAIAAWHAILESAATCNAGGCFDTTPRRVAAILCEPLAVIEAIFAEFVTLGMVADGCVAAWKHRQYESDSSTERSRAYRERKRNGDATLQQRHVTPPETETETEITANAVIIPSKPKATEAGFETFWQRYPRRVGKQAALKAWLAAQRRGHDTERIMAGLARHDGAWPDETEFIPHPATWLNQGRYDDEPEAKRNGLAARNGSAQHGQHRRGDPALDMLRDAMGGGFAAASESDTWPPASGGRDWIALPPV